MICISDYLRNIYAGISVEVSGDVVRKFRPMPKIKRPRRNSPTKNRTDQDDYYTKKQREHREDTGTAKVPEKVKEWRKKQKKESQVNINKEAGKLYQVFIKTPIFKRILKKYPNYNNQQYRQATSALFQAFQEWMKKYDKKYAKGGEYQEYANEVAHLVKTKIRAGIT